MKIALLLIALGFGYKVFADATKEQGVLKVFGRIIGIVMMVTSLLLGATLICIHASSCPAASKICKMITCPMMK